MAETCKLPHGSQHCKSARNAGEDTARDTARSRTVPATTSFARTAGIANTTSSAKAKTFMLRPPEAMRARKDNYFGLGNAFSQDDFALTGLVSGVFYGYGSRMKLDKKLERKLDEKP